MLEVIEANGLVTVQDLGRRGWRRFGVPLSGPMDAFAFQAANSLVGNPLNTAALEIGAGELELETDQDCVIAAAGVGYTVSVYIWEFQLWDSYFVRAGWRIRLKKNGYGMWAYLAVAGGFDTVPVLNSHSTFLRSRLGGLDGQSLQGGDQLKIGTTKLALADLAARRLVADARPAYTQSPLVDVILGPQAGRFTDESLETFLSSPYRVSTTSDRMGYRMEGTRLEHHGNVDMISEGMDVGSVQIPPDGQPIVMMADCATTGGYPKVASVIHADLPLLAQCTPGADSVRFRETTVEAAQDKYRTVMEKMKDGVVNL